MTPKPLKIIETECGECNGFGTLIQLRHQPLISADITCQSCKGKGKQTIIIERADDFKCKYHKLKSKLSPNQKCNNCKGTGYILPKKGEVLYKIKNEWHFPNSSDEVIKKEMFRDEVKKFHLTSDSELAEVSNYYIMSQLSINDIKEHNLKKSDKIVISEGYYE